LLLALLCNAAGDGGLAERYRVQQSLTLFPVRIGLEAEFVVVELCGILCPGLLVPRRARGRSVRAATPSRPACLLVPPP